MCKLGGSVGEAERRVCWRGREEGLLERQRGGSVGEAERRVCWRGREEGVMEEEVGRRVHVGGCIRGPQRHSPM